MALDPNGPSIYPVLRYRDANEAIRVLTEGFGLTELEAHRDPEGNVGHAELAWHNGIIMLSSRTGDTGPFDLGPICVYLAVDDPDAHHDRAVAAGIEIVLPLTDHDFGSRGYTARDFEGNVWSFGTHQPAVGSASA